jgi:hypothetical protein
MTMTWRAVVVLRLSQAIRGLRKYFGKGHSYLSAAALRSVLMVSHLSLCLEMLAFSWSLLAIVDGRFIWLSSLVSVLAGRKILLPSAHCGCGGSGAGACDGHSLL